MTYLKDVFGQDMFKNMDKFLVGFDDSFSRMTKFHEDLTKNVPNYPPYNIKKTADNKYVIEMAVAGFGQNDIEITLEDNKLIIEGKVANEEDAGDYLWKGIAARHFTRTFMIQDAVEVKNAAYLNGMLRIFLDRIIPEHKKVKIEVETPDTKKFLREGE